jgi:hypothetical protein
MHFYTRKPARFSPALNLLEGRALPSATVAVLGSKLDITCDAAGSSVQIRDNGKGDVAVSVRSIDGTVTASAHAITDIAVHGKAGNDTVDFRTTGNLITALNLHEDLGAGNDYAYTDLYNGISGVPLNIDIDGGAGADSAVMHFGAITKSTVNVHAALGDGADSFSAVMFAGAGPNSVVNMSVAGQGGPDRVDYNVMGKIDATATVTVQADNTAAANDRLVVRYHGELDGKLNVNVNGAASLYGVQALFGLDPASTGSLTTVVQTGTTAIGSTAQVTDHAGGTVVTILDRLENILTEPMGMTVTRFTPKI